MSSTTPSSSSFSAPLHRRADSPTRGRHLVATRAIPRGRLIFAERPLVALQSLDNQQDVKVCHCCKAFIGGPDYALVQRFTVPGGENDTVNTLADVEQQAEDDAYKVVPCRHACGHLYCSTVCETDAWDGFHCALCTGVCTSIDEPLVQFKQYATATNEILLLVAEWWAAQHLRCGRDGEADPRYTDFSMPLWWDVVAHDSDDERRVLQETTREICAQTADWLNQTWQVFNERSQKSTSHNAVEIPAISDEDIARWIGACEQNSMGIRQRHPLCRAVLEDSDLRQRRHDEIVQCLVEAGFIGDGHGNEGDEESEAGELLDVVEPTAEKATPALNSTGNKPAEEADTNDNNAGWEISNDDIERYLAESLFIDEDSSVCDAAVKEDRVRDTVGDDLDYIFPPLDGTAMYYTACKMNHSCDPNVIVLYKGRGWGQKYPLTAYCIAFKDIHEGEELTISYIETSEPLEKRQEALTNYGFVCACSKCTNEKNGETVASGKEKRLDDMDSLFGVDEDEGGVEEETRESDTNQKTQLNIQQKVERLDSAVNHSKFANIPLELHGKVCSFALRAGGNASKLEDVTVQNIWAHCQTGIQEHDFVLCKIAGFDLEEHLYKLLQKQSSWPTTDYRTVYGAACLVAALGLAHECSFIPSLNYLDKAMILGLPRSDDHLFDFFDYVEQHAYQIAFGPYTPSFSRRCLPTFMDADDRLSIQDNALSKPIEYGVLEGSVQISHNEFTAQFVSKGVPVVLRGFAAEWRCVQSWRDLDTFGGRNGIRLVPIEVGSMMNGNIQEKIVSLRSFVDDYLASRLDKPFCTLHDSIENAPSVAYMAQHPLTDQIPSLRRDINVAPSLCGLDGPSHTYFWFGTGGTRTPLHFDSYDNLFVQVVGAKYVRLYGAGETPKLYVNKSGYGLQGNMSDVDCENENFAEQPLAESAKFEEALLFPGDALYIPSRTWHYIRSLTTSISINYWF